MFKVSYIATAKSRIHHGSDKQTGNIKLFRRESVRLHPEHQVSYKSKFKSEETRRRAIVAVLKTVYYSISREWKESHYTVLWDQFSARCFSAAIQSDNQYSFLNSICQMFNITTISDPGVISFLDNFGEREFNQTIIDELQYLIAFLRLEIQKAKDKEDLPLFDDGEPGEKPDMIFEQKFASIPYISGNSIGGNLRRLLVYDFCDRVGIRRDLFDEKDDDVTVSREIYHQLMTGGNITENTGFEDIGRREKFLQMCPPIALLGSAIGNMTIRGKLAIGDMQLRCKEMLTGDEHYYKFLSIDFGTRMDSEKQETDIKIGHDSPDGKTPHQMIYYNEVISKGAEFDHWYRLDSDSPVLMSCFWHGISLFKQTPFVGGKRKVGLGEVQFDIDIPDGAEKPYLDYINEHKEEMLKYFSIAEIG